MVSSVVPAQNEATVFAEISVLEVLRFHSVILWVNAYGGILATGVSSSIGFLIFGKVDENLIFQGELSH